jgi:hypothetical protein
VDADAVARCECAGRHGGGNAPHSQCASPAVPDRHLTLMAPLHCPACPCRRGGPAAARRLLLGRCLGGDGHPLLLLRAVRAVAAGSPACHRCAACSAVCGGMQEL